MSATIDVGPRDQIHQGMEQLRRMCDPQGHDLLDAIEDTLVAQADAVVTLLEVDMRWGAEPAPGSASAEAVAS